MLHLPRQRDGAGCNNRRCHLEDLHDPDEPKRRGTSSAGVPLWGPAGAAIWSAPTIDARRGLIYVATGNQYSGPSHPSSNAVIALDMKSGSVRWFKQVTPGDIYVSNCRAGNPNCPETNGPDFDFGSPPMLARTPAGRDLIVIGQKSGVGYALDPEKMGEIVWEYRAGRGGRARRHRMGRPPTRERAYFAVSDITLPQPGGLHAVTLATGQRAWFAPPRPPACGTGRGCNAAQSRPVTVIPGAVFSGSNDGACACIRRRMALFSGSSTRTASSTTVNGVPRARCLDDRPWTRGRRRHGVRQLRVRSVRLAGRECVAGRSELP
jgi:polyvinyl alcohol dehydrogenase (cytochrome)